MERVLFAGQLGLRDWGEIPGRQILWQNVEDISWRGTSSWRNIYGLPFTPSFVCCDS